jgi:hypothetical protein
VSTASRKTRIWKGFLSLAVLAVLALTLGSVVFSGASFTTASANPASVFTAGKLLHTNDQAGRITVDAAGLLPGMSRGGTIRLTNSGNVQGRFTLSAAGLSDIPSRPRLSDTLTLTVKDAGGSPLYEGPVSGFSTVDLGTLAPGAACTLVLTVAYPDGAIDIGLQGAATSLGLQITGVTS